MTIEEPDENGYRRVYGHIAVWSRPHIGFNGQRIYAPRSRCDYAFFNTGAVRCLDEDGTTRIAAVGHLTMDTNHADLALPAAAAARHYDHTGYAWADVAVGGDQFGTWSNGITKQDITEDQIAYAYAHPPSGDWRPLDGGLEIVAALCVNTPGIPVSRARVASGEVVALVAAGALAPTHPASGLGAMVDYEQLADVIADRILTRQQHTAALTARRTAALAATDDNAARMAELLAEIPDETADFALTSDEVASFDIGRMPPQLRESYLHGKAAAKILWGTPGDFARCEAEALHHGIPGRMRPGMCATLHKEALGVAPGKEHGKK